MVILGLYKGYNLSVDFFIFNEFVIVVFRFGYFLV